MENTNDEKDLVTVEEILSEVVALKLGALKDLEPGSEEHSRATEDAAKLARVYFEDRRAVEDREVNSGLKMAQIDAERDAKTEDIIERKWSRWVEWGLKIAEITIPAVVTIGCLRLNNQVYRESLNEVLNFETGNAWGGGITRSVGQKLTSFFGKKV